LKEKFRQSLVVKLYSQLPMHFQCQNISIHDRWRNLLGNIRKQLYWFAQLFILKKRNRSRSIRKCSNTFRSLLGTIWFIITSKKKKDFNKWKYFEIIQM